MAVVHVTLVAGEFAHNAIYRPLMMPSIVMAIGNGIIICINSMQSSLLAARVARFCLCGWWTSTWKLKCSPAISFSISRHIFLSRRILYSIVLYLSSSFFHPANSVLTIDGQTDLSPHCRRTSATNPTTIFSADFGHGSKSIIRFGGR